MSIAHAAHVTGPGYVPYVAMSAGPGRSRERRSLAVLWLDEQQLERTDQTEPNYELVSIDGGRHPVEATTQASVLALLAEHDWFRALVPAADPVEIVERLRTDGGLRDEVKRQMAARGLGCDDGLGDRSERPDDLRRRAEA